MNPEAIEGYRGVAECLQSRSLVRQDENTDRMFFLTEGNVGNSSQLLRELRVMYNRPEDPTADQGFRFA